MALAGGVLVLVLVASLVLRLRAGHPPANAPGRTAQAGTAAQRVVLDERFGTNQRNWPNNPQATAWLAADGSYHLLARQPGQFVAVGAPGVGVLRDVAVTASFRKVGGPAGGGYGVIVRDQGPGPRDGMAQGGRYYVFEVGDRGEVGVWRREDDRWVDLLPWTASPAVRPGGASNELVVQAIGPQLTFRVNGTQVASLQDATLPGGTVGLFAGGDLNEVAVERFAVQASG